MLVTSAGIEPATSGVKVRYLDRFDHDAMWCLRARSGRRHAALQAAALPSELRGHIFASDDPQMCRAMVGREGLEPSMFLTCLIYSQMPSPLGYRPMTLAANLLHF